MRIVSGKYRGRAINPPKNLRARPTTDFAKENLFNVLGNLLDFEECDVLDLFAGTGSISYEFASRGARSVTAVEINAVHHDFIRRTAALLGIENFYPVKANVFLYLKSCAKQFDVIFSDAPYDLVKYPKWQQDRWLRAAYQLFALRMANRQHHFMEKNFWSP